MNPVSQDQVTQTIAPSATPSDKELNFRKLESKYEQLLSQEREARLQAERAAQEALSRRQQIEEEEEDDSEPINHKKLTKTLNRFGEQTKSQTQNEIRQAVNQALAEERKNNWLKNNSDFYDVIQKHADELHRRDPELAETILEMPEGFERQKLVYKNIKALGLHKPPEPAKSTIQDKVDLQKRSPYYQPSGVGSAPYAMQGDFSASGQKNAYDKMQALKKSLRL